MNQLKALAAKLGPQLLASARASSLTSMGVQAASWAVQDFRALSAGRTVEGRRWAPLTRAAIVSRLRARAPWKNDSAALAALRDQEEPLKAELRRKLRPGPEFRAQRGAVAAEFVATSKEWRAIRKKRATIKARRKRTIDRERAKAKILVDTGRLVNSIVYGVPELAGIRSPFPLEGDPPPIASFETRAKSITLGSNLEYAAHVDAKRPIFPDDFSHSRKAALTKIATLVMQKTLDAIART